MEAEWTRVLLVGLGAHHGADRDHAGEQMSVRLKALIDEGRGLSEQDEAEAVSRLAGSTPTHLSFLTRRFMVESAIWSHTWDHARTLNRVLGRRGLCLFLLCRGLCTPSFLSGLPTTPGTAHSADDAGADTAGVRDWGPEHRRVLTDIIAAPHTVFLTP
eukprot:3421782-Rhodomonas_salina.1